MKEKEQFIYDVEKAPVFDPRGVQLGIVCNFSFDPTDYKLKHIIICTAGETELAFEIDQIAKLEGRKIYLNGGSETLCFAYELADVTFFEKLRQYHVVGSDNELIGKITDAVFHIDNRISFIVGSSGSVFQKMGLTNKDLFLLPTNYITKIENDRIEINQTKEDLTRHLKSNVETLTADAYKMSSEQLKDPRIYTRIG